MLLSRHHEIITHWILWLCAVNIMYFIMVYVGCAYVCRGILTHSHPYTQISAISATVAIFAIPLMNASLLLIYATPFSLDFSSMHQVSSEITTSWQMFTLLLYHLVHHKELQESSSPRWIWRLTAGLCEASRRADWTLFACVSVRMCSPPLWKVCFFAPQTQGIWAAPLMMVFVAGSGTKMETCTGRQRLIHQVVKMWWEKEEGAVLLSCSNKGKCFIL